MVALPEALKRVERSKHRGCMRVRRRTSGSDSRGRRGGFCNRGGKALASAQSDITARAAQAYGPDSVLLNHGAGTQQVMHLRRVQGFSESEHARIAVRVHCPKKACARSRDLEALASGRLESELIGAESVEIGRV